MVSRGVSSPLRLLVLCCLHVLLSLACPHFSPRPRPRSRRAKAKDKDKDKDKEKDSRSAHYTVGSAHYTIGALEPTLLPLLLRVVVGSLELARYAQVCARLSCVLCVRVCAVCICVYVCMCLCVYVCMCLWVGSLARDAQGALPPRPPVIFF